MCMHLHTHICIAIILKVKNVLDMQGFIKLTNIFLVEDNKINACVKCTDMKINRGGFLSYFF